MAFILHSLVRVYIMAIIFKYHGDNHGMPWDKEHKRQVAQMDNAGYSNHDIAQHMGRTVRAIECQLETICFNHEYNAFVATPPTTTQIKETTTMSHTTRDDLVTIQPARTMIGNTPADNRSVEDILDAIEREESYVARLETFKCKSEAITKLITKHALNIDALVKIIDDREDA